MMDARDGMGVRVVKKLTLRQGGSVRQAAPKVVVLSRDSQSKPQSSSVGEGGAMVDTSELVDLLLSLSVHPPHVWVFDRLAEK